LTDKTLLFHDGSIWVRILCVKSILAVKYRLRFRSLCDGCSIFDKSAHPFVDLPVIKAIFSGIHADLVLRTSNQPHPVPPECLSIHLRFYETGNEIIIDLILPFPWETLLRFLLVLRNAHHSARQIFQNSLQRSLLDNPKKAADFANDKRRQEQTCFSPMRKSDCL